MMARLPALFSTAPFITALLASLILPQAAAFWRLPCAMPVLVERADPIIDTGTVSGHLHTIMGGNGFDFTMDYQKARSSNCSSCSVTQDFSNYWIPTVFYRAKNGSFHPVEQIGGATIYYLQRPDPKDEKLVAFPAGFRMVTGDPMTRQNNFTSGMNPFEYVCLDYSGNSKGKKDRYDGFPDRNCPSGLRVQVFFPSCWNGKDLDSPDHKSHMAYPAGINSGKCPSSHPVHFISIFYEVIFDVNKWKDQWYDNKQPFVLSNGDPTGFSVHGDFFNGWDVGVLQKAIETCTSNSGVVEECKAFQFFNKDITQDCSLPPRIDEQTTGWMDRLPGCNPIQPGPGRAIKQTNCGAQEKIGAPKQYSVDVSSKGWEYVGCVLDVNNARTFPERKDANDMTVEKCIDHCTSKSFTWAGLQYGRECYCGKNAPPKERMGFMRCGTPCAGNPKQFCGNALKLSTYKKSDGPSTGA